MYTNKQRKPQQSRLVNLTKISNSICRLLPIQRKIQSDYGSFQIGDTDNKDNTECYALIIGTQTGNNVNFMGHSGLMLEGYFEPKQEHWHQFVHYFPENADRTSIFDKIKGVEGKVKEEDKATFDQNFNDKVAYPITGYTNLNNAQNKINHDKKDAPMYKLLSHNCATWTANVAKEAGVFWKLPFPYIRPAAMMSWRGYIKSWIK